ncbi:MAG: hypothetical protein H7Z37_08640 [Pyrinomonadaceae bacterium]|nr:hypothetical protein [Pyrinomonadaceae bacterium]
MQNETNSVKESVLTNPTLSKPAPRGVVNPRAVRVLSFIVITFSLVACTVLCILAIWKFTESDAVWRAIATFIVVIISTAIFTVVNEKLG